MFISLQWRQNDRPNSYYIPYNDLSVRGFWKHKYFIKHKDKHLRKFYKQQLIKDVRKFSILSEEETFSIHFHESCCNKLSCETVKINFALWYLSLISLTSVDELVESFATTLLCKCSSGDVWEARERDEGDQLKRWGSQAQLPRSHWTQTHSSQDAELLRRSTTNLSLWPFSLMLSAQSCGAEIK